MVARIYADTVTFEPAPREEWMEEAACLPKDPEMFFKKDSTDAKEVCESCTVRIQCLAKALVDEKGTSRRTGIFGGMGPREREKLQEQLDLMQKANATATSEQEEEQDNG